jgi:hypothetical protein
MSFSVNMYHAVIGTIGSHKDAVAFYHSCRDRGEFNGERRIKGKENSKQMGVTLALNGDVEFRYHRTDVIVWHRNNSYTINTFSSISTCAFASAFMPFQHNLTKTGSHIEIGGWEEGSVHAIISTATIKGDKVKTDGVFTKEVLNRKAAKKVLDKTSYGEYRKWHAAMYPMVKDDMPPAYQREFLRYGYEDGGELLENPDEWHRLMMSRQGTPDAIRSGIYEFNCGEVYHTVTQKTLTSKESRSKWEVRYK